LNPPTSEPFVLPPYTTSVADELGQDEVDKNDEQGESKSFKTRLYPAVNDVDFDEKSNVIVETNVTPNKRKRHGAGLGNLGNTCFMNSTLQCLAHTHPLRRYFVSGDYEMDLNRNNPLGTGGELATQFAELLAEMWGSNALTAESRRTLFPNNSSSVVYPRNFKLTLGKHAEQFMGYDQHDSQELATYLLDALHEDTNRVTKKPYIEKAEKGEDEPDDVAADKAWRLHLQREDSRVLENFMGQVKSRVQCPEEGCGRISTTFDPFMYLSVPIPGATDRTMQVTFFPLDPQERKKNIKVTLPKSSTLSALLQKVSIVMQAQGITPELILVDNLRAADVWSGEIYQRYRPDDVIDKIRDQGMCAG
jgi:ubiquitin carboxyl-terminal hydrolase 4/11/15